MGLLLIFTLLSFPARAADRCTYETWDWNTGLRRAENHRRVEKPRAALTNEEKGPVPGCSVCEEDQAEVRLEGLAPFRICRLFRDRVERALLAARREGFPLLTVVGYRVGRSKGGLDAEGRRTELSNHSFGTALDVNSGRNGLYDRCEQFGPACHLLRGGAYRPGEPGSITKESPLVRELRKEGFRWGGELRGLQKDFMHFSRTGG
jgi:hypothetical protein